MLLCALPACGGGNGAQAAPASPETSSEDPTAASPTAAGRIGGRILGPVAEGVLVELVGPVDATVVTDAEGQFEFTDLPPGVFSVTPEASNTAYFTPASATIETNGDGQSIEFTSTPLPSLPPGFPDIGDEIWAWGWAGQDSSNLVLVEGIGGRPQIAFMGDLSGLGHHFFNDNEDGRASYYADKLQVPASELHGAHTVDLPVIGVDSCPGANHYGSVYYQSQGMGATADFYVVCAMVNTRDLGVRELFGTDATNFVRFDQGEGDLYLTIAGVERKITENRVPHGALVIEIWRDQGDQITVLANGVDVTTGSITMTGEFDVNGFGFNQIGNSYFDDYLLELIYCDALPREQARNQVREYLRLKWGLF